MFWPKLDSRFGPKLDLNFGQKVCRYMWGGGAGVDLVCHTVICIFSVAKKCYKMLLRGVEMISIENATFYKNRRLPCGKAYKISDLGERAPKGRASPSR